MAVVPFHRVINNTVYGGEQPDPAHAQPGDADSFDFSDGQTAASDQYLATQPEFAALDARLTTDPVEVEAIQPDAIVFDTPDLL